MKKKLLASLLAMAIILGLFLLIGGIPKRGAIYWKLESWSYRDRSHGFLRYTAAEGGEFTVKRKFGGRFIINLDGVEYPVAVKKSSFDITFPDGITYSGTVSAGTVSFPTHNLVIPPRDDIFLLAAELGRVFPSLGGYFALGTLIFVLGAVLFSFPLAAAKLGTFSFFWMVKDPEPTSQYVLFTQITGAVLFLGGWTSLLLILWRWL